MDSMIDFEFFNALVMNLVALSRVMSTTRVCRNPHRLDLAMETMKKRELFWNLSISQDLRAAATPARVSATRGPRDTIFASRDGHRSSVV